MHGKRFLSIIILLDFPGYAQRAAGTKSVETEYANCRLYTVNSEQCTRVAKASMRWRSQIRNENESVDFSHATGLTDKR